MRLARPARAPAPTVEEWLAAQRVVEERRAALARSLEVASPFVFARLDPPCPIRAMTAAEREQQPRALLDHRSVGAGGLVTALQVDAYRAKKARRDE